MLQRIRDNASGPIAYVVVALITLVFGVWGIGSYFTPSSDPVVASVGSSDITRGQLQNAYNQQYRRLRQVAGDNFDPGMIDADSMRRNVLQGLIDHQITVQHADSAGYRVTDAAILATLRGMPQLQRNGRFSPELYRAALARQGRTPAGFEAQLRLSLKSAQLRNEIVSSAFAAPPEVDQAWKLANQQRKVRLLSFDAGNYRDQVKVSAAEIKGYYQKHGDQFQRPARVKLAWVSLDRANAAPADYAPDEKTLRSLYAQNKQRFGQPETRSGGELTIPTKDDASAARSAIQTLAGKAGQTDLEALAANNDAASYEPLDAARRDDLPDAVAKALFDLKPGQTSSPIRGDNAWYLLHLDKITPASTPDFDDADVQSRLKAEAATQAANKAFDDKSDKLESLAFEAPNDLKTISDQLGLEVRHSGWISAKAGQGIGQYDAVRKAAFSDAVLKDKLNSEPVQLGADRYVVLRVSAHESAQTKPLDTVRDRIRQRLLAQKAAEKAQAAAQHALERVRSGKTTFAAIASNDKAAKLSTPGYIARSGSSGVGAQVRAAAFRLARPEQGQTAYTVTKTGDGGFALLALSGVRLPDDDQSGDQRKQIASQQRRRIARQEYAAMHALLKKRADVEINQTRLN